MNEEVGPIARFPMPGAPCCLLHGFPEISLVQHSAGRAAFNVIREAIGFVEPLGATYRGSPISGGHFFPGGTAGDHGLSFSAPF